MNFIFVSPHFPQNYWEFCKNLKQNGMTVLGIADAPYESLSPLLRENLTEYYRVDNMEDYDQMYRAVAYFAFKYGKIDWLESNNEHWLEQDARLRTDFNISTGIHADRVATIKEKSKMKDAYRDGGIPSARQIKAAEGYEAVKEFVKECGYPIISKPDVGVGAGNTYKIDNDTQLDDFFKIENTGHYVIEEFVTGDLFSYDAIVDNQGEPIFESQATWPTPIMDVVNKQVGLCYYVEKEIDEGLQSIGRKTVKAFGVKSRFVHLEFFRLDRDRPSMGKKGDYVGLEVNMRPAGGFTPDMMNYSHNTDVYRIWADMVAFNSSETGRQHCEKTCHNDEYYCVYASRRDIHNYAHSHDNLLETYHDEIMMDVRIPDVLAGAMGNHCYIARLKTPEARDGFIAYVTQLAEQ